MTNKRTNVFGMIMAGGSGERFWPLSRAAYPKQFLSLLGQGSMLQQAYRRLALVVPKQNIFVLGRRGIEKIVAEQIPGLPRANNIAEPVGRDTSACIALAACLAYRRDPDAVLVIVPSDHLVQDVRGMGRIFKNAVLLAAQQDVLITFGIPPWEPATGYGYIQAGPLFEKIAGQPFYRVARFHEKPDRKTAEKFLASGRYWWNSGIFVGRVKTFMEEIQAHLPQHGLMCQELLRASSQKKFDAIAQRLFPALPKISIDYGVLEKSKKVLTARAEFGWDDLGSWLALERYLKPDAQGNIVLGNAHIVEGQNNIVRSGKGHLIGLLGVDNLIVVHAKDATLICDKRKDQQLKKLVQVLKADAKASPFL